MYSTMVNLRFSCLLLLQLCSLIAAQKTELDSPTNLQVLGQIRKWLFQNLGADEERQRFSARSQHKVQEVVPSDVPFPCNVTGGRSPKVPTSVHRLRPGDIDVIAAMGDSLTAGAGILGTNVIEITVENRGLVGSIGGEGNWRTYLTLPNILKEFNPKLLGYALGNSYTSHSASQLNVAESGAVSRDMPFMAKYLINKMKNDSRIDIKRHWKFISLFIGSNDICSNICMLPSPWSVIDSHRIDLVNTLRILRDNLPRTMVSIVVMPHLKCFVDSREGRESLKCYITAVMECPCLMALQFKDRKQEYYDIITRWQNVEEEVADYPQFHRNDFTVVALPGIKKCELPRAADGFLDESFLSADCFHASQKANAYYANIMWNNLLEPYGNKSDTWLPPYKQILCPTPERPFLMTRENS